MEIYRISKSKIQKETCKLLDFETTKMIIKITTLGEPIESKISLAKSKTGKAIKIGFILIPI